MTIKITSELFRTVTYEITVINSGLNLYSTEREIIIPFNEIKELSISQSNGGAARLAITAEKESISGVFDKPSDVDEFVRLVREKSGRIIQTDLRFQ